LKHTRVGNATVNQNYVILSFRAEPSSLSDLGAERCLKIF
jgi:hypothetical protein